MWLGVGFAFLWVAIYLFLVFGFSWLCFGVVFGFVSNCWVWCVCFLFWCRFRCLCVWLVSLVCKIFLVRAGRCTVWCNHGRDVCRFVLSILRFFCCYFVFFC